MPESDTDRGWHHETTKILEELDRRGCAEAKHYMELKLEIGELRSDLRVHKVKTGIFASISAAIVAAVTAWGVSLLRGGG